MSVYFYSLNIEASLFIRPQGEKENKVSSVAYSTPHLETAFL